MNPLMKLVVPLTEWRYHVQIITRDKAVGDMLSEVLGAFIEVETNEEVRKESPFIFKLSDGAWAAGVTAVKVLVDAIDVFNDGGYPELMLARGLTEEQIDGLRQVVMIDYYDVYPDKVHRVVNINALGDFISSNGFIILEEVKAPFETAGPT